jgi:hypothetical protein
MKLTKFGVLSKRRNHDQTVFSQLVDMREDIVRRWEEAGFLDGLVGHTNEFAGLYESEPRFIIPENDRNINGITVNVAERPIRARWSPEVAQDIAAFHHIDAEAELTRLLADQLAQEIDREVLDQLRNGPNTAVWDIGINIKRHKGLSVHRPLSSYGLENLRISKVYGTFK